MKLVYRIVHTCGLEENYAGPPEQLELDKWPHCAEGGVGADGRNCRTAVVVVNEYEWRNREQAERGIEQLVQPGFFLPLAGDGENV